MRLCFLTNILGLESFCILIYDNADSELSKHPDVDGNTLSEDKMSKNSALKPFGRIRQFFDIFYAEPCKIAHAERS